MYSALKKCCGQALVRNWSRELLETRQCSQMFLGGIVSETRGALLHPVEDACRMLGIHRTTLYELIGRGAVQRVKIGRKSLITADSIERFVASLRAGETHDA